MKLDKRIKSVSDIITCFDDDKYRAQPYIGQEGYFTNNMMDFEDLDDCSYGVLKDFSIYEYPFICKTGNTVNDVDYAFFIPESSLKLEPKKEKKYRPYTFREFKNIFPIGQPIKYRRKGNVGLENEIVLDGYAHEQRGDQIFTYIFIGVQDYTLQELFEEYEWQATDSEEFKPFGVEE